MNHAITKKRPANLTQSGRRLYGDYVAVHPVYIKFSEQDHLDAATWHRDRAGRFERSGGEVHRLAHQEYSIADAHESIAGTIRLGTE